MDEKTRIQKDTEKVIEELKTVLKDPEDWLDRKVPALGNKTPRNCIEDGETQKVLHVIKALKEGIFM